MKKNQIFALWIFVFVVLASLAFWSCGGGGGGGEVPETNVALTAENSPKAAAGILKALDIANALQGISGIISPATSSEGASMTQSPIGSLLMMTTTALKKNE